MEAHDLDVLVLGPAGQRPLRVRARRSCGWPERGRSARSACSCASPVQIHLLSTWDEGIPEDIPHENLYGIAWNPMNTDRGAAGTSTARRRRDASEPTRCHRRSRSCCRWRSRTPSSSTASCAMRAARRIKTAEEVDAMRAAVAGGRGRPGRGGGRAAARGHRAALDRRVLEAMAAGGVTHAGDAGRRVDHVARAPVAAGARRRPVRAGDLVAFAAGVARRRLRRRGRPDLAGRRRRRATGRERCTGAGMTLWDRLLAACRPGAPASDLLDAYEAAGEPLPPMPVARGLGLGFDPPVVTPRPARDRRRASASRRAWCWPSPATSWEEGVGAVFGRDAVLVTDDGPEVLTSSPSWPSCRRSLQEPTDVRRRDAVRRKRSSSTRRIPRPRSPRSRSTVPSSSTRRPSRPGCATPTCCTAPTSTTTSRCWSSAASATTSAAGADLPEFMAAQSADGDGRGWPRVRAQDDDDVTYPPTGSFRAGAHAQPVVRQRAVGLPQPAGLQEDQHPRGQGLLLRLALLPGRRRRPRDLVRRRAVRPSRRSATSAGARACGSGRMMMGLRKFQEMVFTGRPFTAERDVRLQLRQQRRAARPSSRPRSRSTRWPARAPGRPTRSSCRRSFFEIMKQHQGEYMGSLLTGVARVDGRLRARRRRRTSLTLSDETMDARAQQRGQGQRRAVPAGVAAEQVRPRARTDDVSAVPDGTTGSAAARRLRRRRPVDRDRRRATARSCWPTAAPRSSRSSRPRATRCGAWSASGAAIDAGDDGALFSFLACVEAERRRRPGRRGRPRTRRRAARSGRRGGVVAAARRWPSTRRSRRRQILRRASAPDRHVDHAVRPRRSVARPAGHRVHAAGLVRRDRRPRPRRRPTGRRCIVGGQVGEWLAGAYAAVGTLASRPRARDAARGELVDVSMLEARSLCLTYYPVTFLEQLGRPCAHEALASPTPGVAAASDGLVGARGAAPAQQWLDFCAMVGPPGVDREDRSLFRSTERPTRRPAIDAWIARPHGRRGPRPGDRPSASRTRPIGNGANVTDARPLPGARDRSSRNPADGVPAARAARTGCDPACLPAPSRRRGSASTPTTAASDRRREPSRHAADGASPSGCRSRAAGPRHDRVLGRARSSRTCWRCSAPR